MKIWASALLLFEASPATVSRCGMIYMEPSALGWRPLRDSYIQSLPESVSGENRELILELTEWLIPHALEFIRHNCQFVIKTSNLHLFQVRPFVKTKRLLLELKIFLILGLYANIYLFSPKWFGAVRQRPTKQCLVTICLYFCIDLGPWRDAYGREPWEIWCFSPFYARRVKQGGSEASRIKAEQKSTHSRKRIHLWLCLWQENEYVVVLARHFRSGCIENPSKCKGEAKFFLRKGKVLNICFAPVAFRTYHSHRWHSPSNVLSENVLEQRLSTSLCWSNWNREICHYTQHPHVSP